MGGDHHQIEQAVRPVARAEASRPADIQRLGQERMLAETPAPQQPTEPVGRQGRAGGVVVT